jgi:hypothetical protein
LTHRQALARLQDALRCSRRADAPDERSPGVVGAGRANDRSSPPRVLTEPVPQRQRRPPLSPRQEYEEFVLQRIEDYKNQLSREELLALADESVQELEAGPDGQLVLTEVLVLEHVDRLIKKRLRLPGYRRWTGLHQRLRTAQREPTHWGLPGDLPIDRLVGCLEPGELAATVGSGAAGAAFLLAAFDVPVTALAESVEAAEVIESRAADQALTRYVQVYAVQLGWLPIDLTPAVVVVDPMVFAQHEAGDQVRTMTALLGATVPGGMHLLLPVDQRGGVRSLAPEALLNHYSGWQVSRGPRSGSRWFIAVKP